VKRRLVHLIAALLALVAVHSAWAAPWVCLAEAEQRVCACQHPPGSGEMGEDCCTRSQSDAQPAPGVNLPSPHFALRVALPPAAMAVASIEAAEAATPAVFPAIDGARSPPATPRFLRLRTLLI